MSRLFVYNPTCEMAVANGLVSYQAPRYLQNFERELETLPAFLGTAKDFILTEQEIPEGHLRSIEKIGIELPSAIQKDKLLRKLETEQIALDSIHPWGWSPAFHHRVKDLKLYCCESFKQSSVFQWHEKQKQFYSREFALKVLQNLITNLESSDLIPQEHLPKTVSNEAEIKEVQKEWSQVVLKSPWSASGRGVQILRRNEFNETNRQIFSGVIKTQGFCMIEKYLNKQLDFAFQFYVEQGLINFLGISFFKTSSVGQYEGNLLGNPNLFLDKTHQVFFDKIQIQNIVDSLQEILQNSDLPNYYEGNFGVDAMLYLDENNTMKLQPCLEINCRNNMGNLALSLNEKLAEDKYGIFRINLIKDIDSCEFEKGIQMDAAGKWISGKQNLTPIRKDSQFVAWLEIK
jgi:hypothetical protein